MGRQAAAGGVAARVVSLAPSNTEIVGALGLAGLLVGVDDWSDHPPEVRRLPRVGPELQIDLDRVAALRPDLVLASLSVPGMERNVAGLRERGLPHLVLDPHSLDDVLADVETVGRALGVEEHAREVAAGLRRRIAAVRERTAARSAPFLRLYWEWWPDPLITPGRRSWITGMSEAAGGENVFADLDAESARVEPDEVLRRRPDAILVCWCGEQEARMSRQVILARPGWAGTPAARAGRVFLLPEGLFGRPGPRLAEGLEMLEELLWTARS